jgi:hypothetical protein
LWLSPRGPHEKPMTGGDGQHTLKKLKGARLCTPAKLTVDTQAMGRGNTESRNKKYISLGLKSSTESEITDSGAVALVMCHGR